MNLGSRSLVLVLRAGCMVAGLAGVASADTSPRQGLRDAATGTWSGDFGTLEFAADGTVHLGGSEELRVGDARCTYTSVFEKKPIDKPCSFVKRSGRTVLVYEAPDLFSAGKIARNGLVYLPGLRLLVSPELVERPFTRATP